MARIVIVGAGVTGLVTAVECALAGHRVTVLDRGSIPSPVSTSFDQHRALRTFVPDDVDATLGRVAAHRRWLELESLLDTRFYRRVGVVTAWPRAQAAVMAGQAMAWGLPVETLEPEKLPHLVFARDAVGVLEVDAGVLLATRVLVAAVRWLIEHPLVSLRPNSRVTAVGTGRVSVEGGVTVRADLVLVAEGPWTAELVGVPVRLHRQTMVYLRPPEPLMRWWENAPGAGGLGDDGRAWLLPPGDGTLLKISSNAVCREVESVDSVELYQDWADQLLAASIVSDVDRYTVVAVKHCHYAADAVTGGAQLTEVAPAVWARAACGGSGFASAPLVAARIVGALGALGEAA
ncbi:glycine/D-amino acid oxidase-like deaminating enzyme [Lentzea nigeriaca]|nr:FAD-binding oxidoreductase [Lentzea nigeriaca]MBM7858675.1 glycine/D-amino acid oxidase-like deaminating enzyme [Lentzea nigeriaca]